ncbi:inter-alpha-trypsin inhibitor heavy chain H3-like isoform X3 [Aquarana catesbeiana]|uniref:inter-alpha-trypsin inhibitor heavy chain H3-like isoform X3 n=1 Tax=Aquarana catesbeiana TaxID=8400 RepID=UPI003CC9A3B3
MAPNKWRNIVVVLLAVCEFRPNHGAPVGSSMDIYRMDIDCKVTSRFARTLITTEIQNTGNSSQEAIFDVELPKTAFITNFSMTVDGVTTDGMVKKKEDAEQQYDRAVSRGESAGLVQSTGRKMENFKICVNVGARATAIFKLTYEELLKRHHGSYELQIKVQPKQLVENFQINVDIIEPQEISFVEAHGTFITNELVDVVTKSHTGNKAHITFKPTMHQQRKCAICSETLLDGEFTIKYDVKRETTAGNIQIVNGYFVHYFAPSSLARLPKNVVFVIDCSGSMRGRKMQQTFEAFTKILEELPEEDHVGILKFNEDVSKWKNNLVKAAPDNIKSAKEFVAQITARGGTNINAALVAAAEMLRNERTSKALPEISTSIIIFLSDGDPTSGVIDLDTIMRNVKSATEGVATLYSLGFGWDVDYGFLEKMSLQNGGLARRIYEDSDSALQLQNFYKEVAFPVLLDVSVQYPDLQVNDLTQNSFNHYYQDSELIVAGHIDNNDIHVLTAQVTAQGASEQFSMKVETNIKEDDVIATEQRYAFGDFTERLWAYLTIEQLLTKQISAEGAEKRNITEEALKLCLKYGFVTPLTSMVITTPEDDNDGRKVVANKPKEDDDALSWTQPVKTAGRTAGPRAGLMPRGRSRSPTRVLQYARLLNSVNLNSPRLIATEVNVDVVPAIVRVPSGRRRKIMYDLNPVEEVTTNLPTIIPGPDVAAVALITLPFASDKIFLGIDETPDTWINLLHSPDLEITLNGKLSPDRRSFARLGLVNRKKSLSMDISAHNITVISGQDTQTVPWTSTLQGVRSVNKEARKLFLTLEGRFRAIVLLKKNPDHLKLHIENKKADSEFHMGLIGQMMVKDNILVESDEVTILGETYPAKQFPTCNFSSYGVKQPGPCTKVTLKSSNAFAGVSHVVPGIFDFPPDS